MLEKAKNGQPVDTWIPDPAEQGPRMTLGKLLVSLGVGCATGGVTVGSMKRSMKTAVRQSGAANYVSRGGVTLSRKQDDFVNRSVTRQVIPRQTSGSRPAATSAAPASAAATAGPTTAAGFNSAKAAAKTHPITTTPPGGACPSRRCHIIHVLSFCLRPLLSPAGPPPRSSCRRAGPG